MRRSLDKHQPHSLLENESDLNDYVAQTEAGWENMDGTKLSGGLSGVQGSIDRLIARDCN